MTSVESKQEVLEQDLIELKVKKSRSKAVLQD